MRPASLLLAAAIGLALASEAGGQTCTGTAVKGNATPASLVFSPPVVTDFDQGHIDYTTSLTLTENLGVKTPWNLCYHANTPTLGTSTTGAYTKPVADLEIKLTGQPDAAFRAVTQTDQLLATFTGKTSVSVDVRVLLAWTLDEPGNYGTTLLLTAFK